MRLSWPTARIHRADFAFRLHLEFWLLADQRINSDFARLPMELQLESFRKQVLQEGLQFALCDLLRAARLRFNIVAIGVEPCGASGNLRILKLKGGANQQPHRLVHDPEATAVKQVETGSGIRRRETRPNHGYFELLRCLPGRHLREQDASHEWDFPAHTDDTYHCVASVEHEDHLRK